MAIEDDLHKRRKLKRAEEDEAERAKSEKKQAVEPTSGSTADLGAPETMVDRLEELFRRAEVMMEQVNGMYSSFIRGLDSQSPLLRRQQLDAYMSTLTNVPKPTAIYRFKFYNIVSSYNQHRDRWDKMMKDLEDGKIKRPPRMKGPFRRSG